MMGNTWITDAEHHVVTPERYKELPLAWRRRADLTCALVVAASTLSPGFLFKSSIACLRKPKRKPCEGTIHFRAFEEPEEINWFCKKCNDNGTITGWKKTVAHFREFFKGKKIHLDPLSELFLTDGEYELISKLHPPIKTVEKYGNERGLVLLGSIAEMEPLLGVVAHARAKATTNDEKEMLLNLFERMEEDLAISKDLAEGLGNSSRPH